VELELLLMVWLMLVDATFSNISVISWWLVLLVEETGVRGKIHRTVGSEIITQSKLEVGAVVVVILG
jgi:hypothetical protein